MENYTRKKNKLKINIDIKNKSNNVLKNTCEEKNYISHN